MGIYDRDYHRGEGMAGRGGRGALADAPVTKWFIIINVVVFILDAVTSNPGGGSLEQARPFFYFGAFSQYMVTEHMQIWRLGTYQFLHGGGFHLFVNMLGLYFFGPMVERWWGARRYIYFYLLCGTIGAVIYTLLAVVGAVPPEQVVIDRFTGEVLMFKSLVGASGSLFGVLIAAAMIAPNARVMLLIPPIPMKLRTLVIVFIGLSAGYIFLYGQDPSMNSGGHAAHLGGALMGWLLMRFPHVISSGGDRVEVITPTRKKRFRVISGQGGERGGAGGKKPTREEVDRVLDKVAKQGVGSLTEDEKRTLQAARDDLLGR